jgi:hypothetical protein
LAQGARLSRAICDHRRLRIGDETQVDLSVVHGTRKVCTLTQRIVIAIGAVERR